jgi:hypothetical protein
MRRIRFRPRHATVVAYVALFVALGGTAMAAVIVNSNSQVAKDTISGHQAPSGKHANLIAGSVNSQDVADYGLTGADLNDSARARGSAATSDTGCDPNSTSFIDCGHVTIHLARISRILIVANALWRPLDSNLNAGTCRIGVDAVPFGPDAHPTETGALSENSLALTNVTDTLRPGKHTLGLACNETYGDIRFFDSYISVVVLSTFQ